MSSSSMFISGSYGSSGEDDGSLGEEKDLNALGDDPGQHVGLLFLEFKITRLCYARVREADG